jgi:transcription-repair coupling factor (superfamily II helicase)
VQIPDFLRLYEQDSFMQTVCSQAKTVLAENKSSRLFLKGLTGSLDAVAATVMSRQIPRNYLFIMADREEAQYFLNDLQNLLPEEEILLFPTSYKKPYQFDETENANVLMRAEVLSVLNQSVSGEKKTNLVVAYPEALSEKVINRKSLIANTFSIKVGEKLSSSFLTELLIGYNFDKTDFVYEAGQFSIRGGIIDIFSYANERPFRLELFGDEIESIRTFDPDTQLSLEEKKEISLIPNVQTQLLLEKRESFLEFLPENTWIWAKNMELTLEILDKTFEQVEQDFQNILARSGGTKVVSEPEALFENRQSFTQHLKSRHLLEFGRKAHFKTDKTVEFSSAPQPSFNKDFNRLVENIQDNLTHNTVTFIVADSVRQTERLLSILDEITMVNAGENQGLRVQTLNIALREGFLDKHLGIACYTDHQIFDRFHKYKTRDRFSKNKSITLKELQGLHPGDYVTHVDYGIGRFAGLEKVTVGEHEQESVRLVFRDNDLLYVGIHALHKISRYSGKEGTAPQMSKLGSPEWENRKSKVKKRVKDMAKELINLYAKRRAAPGFAFSKDSFLQAELETSFIYEDTPDQAKATADVKDDMEQPHPMDRLVCGDVGFGKTEIAIRAAFKACCDNKQVAVLVPTTILAMQHYRTFRERLEKFPVKVEYINRFKTTQQIKETLKKTAEGEVNILIGTHRIVSQDVKFKDLGLLIVDEEQKFGVGTKEKLKKFRVNVDSLTLTATPIPRTLHFSLMGARDLSVIATPPPNRQPVTTEVVVFDEKIIRDAVSQELKRGGQVFFVHNRVSDIESMGNLILRMVPDAKIAIVHGQMDGDRLEKTMMRFVEGEIDVLVSTNIIESGLDVSNANTIMINNAHFFGLSDLHQMRGRVGRSNKKAFCYLLTPPVSTLSNDARKRLQTLEEFSELGDGFKVAMRDLDIRGAGDLLGGEQSGFISDVGFEMYHKILDEAVQELKEEEFKELFAGEFARKAVNALKVDCAIETDLQILIPEQYVSSISERLSLYTKLDSLETEQQLTDFETSLTDRFGPLPADVRDLLETVRLRWLAERLGFEKMILKNGSMKCYFVPQTNEAYFQSAVFGEILQYVQKHPAKSRMKELKEKLMLIFEEIKSVRQAKKILAEIEEGAIVGV